MVFAFSGGPWNSDDGGRRRHERRHLGALWPGNVAHRTDGDGSLQAQPDPPCHPRGRRRRQDRPQAAAPLRLLYLQARNTSFGPFLSSLKSHSHVISLKPENLREEGACETPLLLWFW